MDSQLEKLGDDCLGLERAAALLLAIRSTRNMLRSTHEAFFRNATALVPDLYELARKDCTSKHRDPDSEHYYISPQYFLEQPPPFSALPTVLGELASSFNLFYARIDELAEFTVCPYGFSCMNYT